MRHWLTLTITTVALLIVGCADTPETIVVGSDDSTEALASATTTTSLLANEQSTTVPGQRPANQSTTRPNQDPADQSVSTTAKHEPELDPVETTKQPDQEWEDHPLARVILTADDMPALGLDAGWEFNWVDFIELDAADHVNEEVCGAAVPVQPSYFVVSFDDEAVGMELQLNVMPDIGGGAASDYLHILELVSTCPDIEDEWTSVSIEVVAIEVEGAAQSVIIAGIDKTWPDEPVGLTLAAAEVDGHLFITFIEQDSGTPGSADIELAVKALELSISRL